MAFFVFRPAVIDAIEEIRVAAEARKPKGKRSGSPGSPELAMFMCLTAPELADIVLSQVHALQQSPHGRWKCRCTAMIMASRWAGLCALTSGHAHGRGDWAPRMQAPLHQAQLAAGHPGRGVGVASLMPVPGAVRSLPPGRRGLASPRVGGVGRARRAVRGRRWRLTTQIHSAARHDAP
jgi:hypothetical protein